MDIHHMPALIVTHRDILLQTRIKPQVIEGIFCGEIGGCQIIIAIGHLTLFKNRNNLLFMSQVFSEELL